MRTAEDRGRRRAEHVIVGSGDGSVRVSQIRSITPQIHKYTKRLPRRTSAGRRRLDRVLIKGTCSVVEHEDGGGRGGVDGGGSGGSNYNNVQLM